jgi:hypothetical protein
LKSTLENTKKDLANATLAAQRERKFQEEVKKQLQNEVANLKKSNQASQKKLNGEIEKIKTDYEKKIQLVKKQAEDEADKAVSSAAYRRK